jgi:magnesium transporter
MASTILTHGHVAWTNITSPTSEDIRQLSACYPYFHPLNLQDCLTELEIPRLNHQDGYLFLVVQMPVWDQAIQHFRAAEVDIFIAQGILVTSHHNELRALVEVFERLRHEEGSQEEWMGQGASYLLYHLLNTLVEDCIPFVKGITHDLRHIEQNLFNNDTRHLLNELSEARRNVIALRSILDPQLGVIRSLEQGQWSFIHEELDPYWRDISDHLAQLMAILQEDAEVVSGLSDTIDTLASHRIDEVVRLLTVVTVLTLPLTLLATIFGMNIVMPYSEHPLLFFAVLGLGLALTLWLVWYFRKKNWL